MKSGHKENKESLCRRCPCYYVLYFIRLTTQNKCGWKKISRFLFFSRADLYENTSSRKMSSILISYFSALSFSNLPLSILSHSSTWPRRCYCSTLSLIMPIPLWHVRLYGVCVSCNIISLFMSFHFMFFSSLFLFQEYFLLLFYRFVSSFCCFAVYSARNV